MSVRATERPAGEEVSRLSLARSCAAASSLHHRFAHRWQSTPRPYVEARRRLRCTPRSGRAGVRAWKRPAVPFCFAAMARSNAAGSPSISAFPLPPLSNAGGAARTSSATSTRSRSPRSSTAGTTTGTPPSSRSVSPGDLEATLAQVRKLNAAAVVVAGDGMTARLPRGTPRHRDRS